MSGPSASPTPIIADHRPIAFIRSAKLREHHADDGEGRGHDQRLADTHDPAGHHELRGGAGVRGGRRRAREQQQSAEEEGFAAEPVGHAAREEHQAGRHQAVDVDQPLQLAGGGAEFVDERRQGDVQHGDVEADDEQAQAEHGQDRPTHGVPAWSAGSGGARRGRHGALLKLNNTVKGERIPGHPHRSNTSVKIYSLCPAVRACTRVRETLRIFSQVSSNSRSGVDCPTMPAPASQPGAALRAEHRAQRERRVQRAVAAHREDRAAVQAARPVLQLPDGAVGGGLGHAGRGDGGEDGRERPATARARPAAAAPRPGTPGAARCRAP